MKLSVIIVNYNVRYYVEQCLHSLERALEGIDSEVIVVDNHSHDGSLDYLTGRFPQVTFIESTRNLGFARGNNIAIRQSVGEYVLLLNPDTFVGEQTLQEAVRFLDDHPDAGAVGVKMHKSRCRSSRGEDAQSRRFTGTGVSTRYPFADDLAL